MALVTTFYYMLEDTPNLSGTTRVKGEAMSSIIGRSKALSRNMHNRSHRRLALEQLEERAMLTGALAVSEGLEAALPSAHRVMPGAVDVATAPGDDIQQENASTAAMQLDDQGLLHPWQNPFNALDADGDGTVLADDAWLIIHDLNDNGARALVTQPPPSGDMPYLDVNGDGFVAPIDALQVINYLRRTGNSVDNDDPGPIENTFAVSTWRNPDQAFLLLGNEPLCTLNSLALNQDASVISERTLPVSPKARDVQSDNVHVDDGPHRHVDTAIDYSVSKGDFHQNLTSINRLRDDPS